VRILIEGITYRYGFETDAKRVQTEWLFQAKKVAERVLFMRKGDEIEVSKGFAEGRGIEEKTRDNALFLSVVAQFNGATATRILKWFGGLMPMHGLHEAGYLGRSIEMLQDTRTRGRLIEFVRSADLGIEDMSVREEKLDPSEMLRFLTEEGRKRFLTEMADAKDVSVAGVHAKFAKGKRIGNVSLDFDDAESAVTRNTGRGQLSLCREINRCPRRSLRPRIVDRGYQVEAVKTIAERIAQSRRRFLLVLATVRARRA